MSPSRPSTGTAIAPTSSVEVSNHSTLPTEVFSRAGSTASTGISIDWESETARAATATIMISTRARCGEV